MPGALVSGAALFRVDLYAATDCATLAGTDVAVASLSRTFVAGAPIVFDAPPGDYAVVVTSYRDGAATEPLGSACVDARIAAGARLCLPLELAVVDLAGGGDPSDLGAVDLAAADLGYVAGTVLARDDFKRPDQKSWGVASDGQAWGASAGGTNSFAIVANVGQVAAGGNATYPANLGPAVGDAEVLASGTIASSGAHWGGELRNAGGGTNYAAMLDGSTLTIRRNVSGASSVLGSASFGAAVGSSYTIRFRAVGAMLQARAWKTGGAEPTAWTVSATDLTPLGPGFGGLRFNVPASSYATVTAFTLVAM